ncbi:MAG: hypothetical protein ACLQPH_10305, partial [Acidimicrobiales bacterium]
MTEPRRASRRLVHRIAEGGRLAEEIRQARMTRRRRRRRLAPPRPPYRGPGIEIGPPDFVGVGVQKCGTTWWFEMLRTHPGVSPRAAKELHFFQHGWDEEFEEASIRRYHEYFPKIDGKLTGEWTPDYSFHPWMARRLALAAPGARILVMMRDPIARLRSGLSHMIDHYGVLPPGIVTEAINFGRYCEQ